MATLSQHAFERYVERVDPSATYAQVAAIVRGASKAIDVAARFGCSVVRLGDGTKLVLQGEDVVTVLPRRKIARPCATMRELA